MSKVILPIFLLLLGCANPTYVTVGTGYKVQELPLYNKGKRINDPVTARIEIGQVQGSWSYGVTHHSQWFKGPPFNKDAEYNKTEIFLDYTWVIE